MTRILFKATGRWSSAEELHLANPYGLDRTPTAGIAAHKQRNFWLIDSLAMHLPTKEIGFYLSYEHVFAGEQAIQPDPYGTKKVCNLAALKKQQIEHLKQSPKLLEPILNELMNLTYKLVHALVISVLWLLTEMDGKVEKLLLGH